MVCTDKYDLFVAARVQTAVHRVWAFKRNRYFSSSDSPPMTSGCKSRDWNQRELPTVPDSALTGRAGYHVLALYHVLKLEHRRRNCDTIWAAFVDDGRFSPLGCLSSALSRTLKMPPRYNWLLLHAEVVDRMSPFVSSSGQHIACRAGSGLFEDMSKYHSLIKNAW